MSSWGFRPIDGFTLGIDSSLLNALVSPTWVDCCEMDYPAFIASEALISVQPVCVCWTHNFPLPFSFWKCEAIDDAALCPGTLADQVFTQNLCFFAGCHHLEARFMPELPLPWWYRYLQSSCLQKPSVCLWEGMMSWLRLLCIYWRSQWVAGFLLAQLLFRSLMQCES